MVKIKGSVAYPRKTIAMTCLIMYVFCTRKYANLKNLFYLYGIIKSFPLSFVIVLQMYKTWALGK